MRKWCLAGMALLLAASVLAAAFTRASYTDFWKDGAGLEHYPVETAWEALGTDTLHACEERMEQAEFIARVRFTGERKLLHQCMLSTVTVEQVYRGDPALTGAAAELYEINWFDIYQNSQKVYRNLSPANLMTEEAPYLVFANRKMRDGTETGRARFRPCGRLGDISLFKLEENRDVPADADKVKNKALTYGDIRQNEFVFSSREALDAALQWKREILSRYGL